MPVSAAGSMPGMIPTPCTTTEPAHPALAVLPEIPTRDALEAFGRYLQSLEDEHAPPEVRLAHHFAGDVYGRSVVIGADTFLVGLPHREDHLNVCVGDITVWTEHGRQRYTGAHIVPAPAGAMRVGFAHADTTWLSVHVNRTGGRDIEAIEGALVEHADRLASRRRAQGSAA